jgi:hypothetical protein
LACSRGVGRYRVDARILEDRDESVGLAPVGELALPEGDVTVTAMRRQPR